MEERDQTLQEIWKKVADTLLDELNADEVSPPMIQAAIRFLAENKTEALPVKGSSLESIVSNIPFPGKVKTG